MITDAKGLKYLQEMNTHICKKCGKKFVNFVGLSEHRKELKHYEYELQGSNLTLMFA